MTEGLNKGVSDHGGGVYQVFIFKYIVEKAQKKLCACRFNRLGEGI